MKFIIFPVEPNHFDMLNDSIRKYWSIVALADYQGENFSYSQVAENIAKLHLFFKNAGIKKGDKIALVGRNSARWCTIYLATVTYGAIIVPILPDFTVNDIQEIINHSDAILLFSSDSIFENLDPSLMKKLKGILSINTFNLLYDSGNSMKKNLEKSNSGFQKKVASGFGPNRYQPPEIPNSELAVISYTSGTTGHSKGVMLSHNSLAANIRFAQRSMPLNPGDPIVSFLPLAHAYGCAFEFLFPFTIGCTVTILTKTPSPQIVMLAFQEIKPALILSVPLVIEKIFKKQILPIIGKMHMKILLAIPGINKIIHRKIREKLVDVFGGKFTEIVIGGAPFNPEAERFFRKINFPYTVGYGMTECGPLISYAASAINRYSSSGTAVDTLDVKIDSDNPEKVAGEIIVRGENVMNGYYKNEEATSKIIDKDSWLHTGDLGLIDSDGFIYIKGRSKSMLLGANGQNIYPEELESALNNRFCIAESLIVQRDDKLVALIFPEKETVEKYHISLEKLQEIMKNHIHEVNHAFPKYMNISKFEVVEEEFAKTPKRSIKRFLYV